MCNIPNYTNSQSAQWLSFIIWIFKPTNLPLFFLIHHCILYQYKYVLKYLIPYDNLGFALTFASQIVFWLKQLLTYSIYFIELLLSLYIYVSTSIANYCGTHQIKPMAEHKTVVTPVVMHRSYNILVHAHWNAHFAWIPKQILKTSARLLLPSVSHVSESQALLSIGARIQYPNGLLPLGQTHLSSLPIVPKWQ